MQKLKKFAKDHETAIKVTVAFVTVAAPAAVWAVAGYRFGKQQMVPVGVWTNDDVTKMKITFKNGSAFEYDVHH